MIKIIVILRINYLRASWQTVHGGLRLKKFAWVYGGLLSATESVLLFVDKVRRGQNN